jgi:hypothetical protein
MTGGIVFEPYPVLFEMILFRDFLEVKEWKKTFAS